MKAGDKVKCKGKTYTILGFRYILYWYKDEKRNTIFPKYAGAASLKEAKEKCYKGCENKIDLRTESKEFLNPKDCIVI